MTNSITRRQALITSVRIASLVAPTSFLAACGKASVTQPTPATVDPNQPQTGLDTRLRQELLDASKAASAGGQWTEFEFNNFIDALGEDSLKRMCKILSVSPAAIEQYSSNPLMKKEITKTVWNATSGITNRDPEKLRYHEKVVVPTATKLNFDEATIATYDTLSLERAIYNRVFEQSWTSLNENERIDFLTKSDWGMPQAKIKSLAALAGGSIMAGFAGLVNLTVFSFYVGMSKGLFAVASSMGLTLPFAAYTTASTAIALATGPVGWIATAILAGAGVYTWLAAQQSSKEATLLSTVLHMHHYKISTLQEANRPFTLTGV